MYKYTLYIFTLYKDISVKLGHYFPSDYKCRKKYASVAVTNVKHSRLLVSAIYLQIV